MRDWRSVLAGLLLLSATIPGCTGKAGGESSASSPLQRALFADDLLLTAQSQSPTLCEAIRVFNKSDTQTVTCQSLRGHKDGIRRAVIFRHLRFGTGIDGGSFEGGSLDGRDHLLIASYTIGVYQDHSGWGYFSNCDLSNWNGLLDIESLPILKGIVSGYVLNEKCASRVGEIADSLGQEFVSGSAVLPATDSWDGASVDVISYLDGGKFTSIAGINSSQNAKVQRCVEGLVLLRAAISSEISGTP